MLKAAQIGLAFALLLALVVFVGGDALHEALSNINLGYLFILLLLSVALIWASCLKWRLFIRENGDDVNLLYLMKIYTIGYFFNLFVPSTLGGDASRSYHLGEHLGDQSQAFVATFLERFSGLLAMCILAFVFVFAGFSGAEGISLTVYVICAIVFVASVACFSSYFSKIFFRILKSINSKFVPEKISLKVGDIIERVDNGMNYARGNTSLFLKALGYSFFFHLLTVVNTYVACLAVGWENPSFTGLFVVVPLILLVGAIPLTPNGVGLQESAFVFFLKRVGSSSSQGLAVALILRAKVLILALIGGAFLIALKRKEERAKV